MVVMRSIGELVSALLPDIEARIFRANAEVTDAVVAHGWTAKRPARPRQRQRQQAAQPAQYEMRV
jgi:hypothetical protein